MPNAGLYIVPDNNHSPAASRPAVQPLAGKTILLVEDESFIAELLISWLGRLGVKTVWAGTGSEGIRLLGEHGSQINVVIADFRLPDMDGDEMCARLRELQPQLPVLLSSGRYHGKAEETLARSGPTCFIQKPYPLEDVLVKLKQLMGAA